MSRFIISKKNNITDIEEPDKITLITQFYICQDNEERSPYWQTWNSSY